MSEIYTDLEQRPTLNDLGLKYATDKSTITHCYLDNYAKYFESWRDKEFTLLEIGVAAGNSIRMWREYFPKAKVYGIDINPDCAGEGIFIGSQADLDFMASVMTKIGAPDIIISDGSHVGDEEVITFKMLFPLLKDGGLYFLEDTHTLYNSHYSGEFTSNGRTKAYNYFTDLVYHVDIAGRAMTGNASYAINSGITNPPVPEFSSILESIHIHISLWLFKRR